MNLHIVLLKLIYGAVQVSLIFIGAAGIQNNELSKTYVATMLFIFWELTDRKRYTRD